MADQAGDFLNEKYTHHFEKDKYFDESRNYKFTYPSLMEAQIRKLRSSLENWKEVVLQLKRLFFWQKQWHPTALIGGSTVLFMLLWLLDPSILTVFSIFGLCFTICDYLLPSVATSLFKPEKWTTRKDSEFEEICTSLVLYKAKLALTWTSFHKMKITNPKMYFMVTVIGLSVLAWVGCTFNNLFLAYILVTFLLLLPGMEHNGIITKSSSYVQGFLSEFVRTAKTKAGQDKKNN